MPVVWRQPEAARRLVFRRAAAEVVTLDVAVGRRDHQEAVVAGHVRGAFARERVAGYPGGGP
jgi:hypothetical protein